MKTFVKSLLPARFISPLTWLYHWFRALPYAGNAVVCPCCGGHFRRFLPMGYVVVRPYAVCPFCNAGERHRLLWLYLRNHTNLFHDCLKVLHFAPEYILEQKFRRCSNLEYITADLNNPAMLKVDITDIPFPDATFDVVLCSHVLEHVPDDRKAMHELYRVLKPGGWAILLVPIELDRTTTFEDPTVTDPQERLRLFNQIDHVRIYGRDYVDRLEGAGFTVRQDHAIREFSPSLVQRYGLRDEPIFFCTHPILS